MLSWQVVQLISIMARVFLNKRIEEVYLWSSWKRILVLFSRKLVMAAMAEAMVAAAAVAAAVVAILHLQVAADTMLQSHQASASAGAFLCPYMIQGMGERTQKGEMHKEILDTKSKYRRKSPLQKVLHFLY